MQNNAKIQLILMTCASSLMNQTRAPLAQALHQMFARNSSLDVVQALASAANQLAPGSNVDALKQTLEQHKSAYEITRSLPNSIIGTDLEPEKLIEQLKVHDSFALMFGYAISQVSKQSSGELEQIKNAIANKLSAMRLDSKERMSLRSFIKGSETFSPVTIAADQITILVGEIYEVLYEFLGPVATDKIMSDAIEHANSKTGGLYDARNFL